ncbi:phosphoglycerate kinase, partial [Candidatus Micrarchaeota archaeon]|nr:phosphoglycerate kinase [Candidatus Micrarchaeota archaeon]
VADGVVQDSPRFQESAPTLRALAAGGARVVILAHQGRPGDVDFVSLAQHAALLSKHVKKKVKFVDDLFGSRALNEIKKLKNGKLLLLENTRFCSEELLDAPAERLAQTLFVKTLASAANAFVNEAFSVSHRKQASIVGFPELLPSYAGIALEREVAALERVTANPERPVVLVLGGNKPDDCIKILNNFLDKNIVDKALLGGLIGELALLAQGRDLGTQREFLEEKGFVKLLPAVKTFLEKHGAKVELPRDLAFADSDGIRVEVSVEQAASLHRLVGDVGSKTAGAYSSALKQAKTVFFKGTLGEFEQPAFELGTRIALKSIADSKAFSVIGGGSLAVAIEKFGFNKKKFSHASNAGGALISFLAGEKLPGLAALEKASAKS